MDIAITVSGQNLNEVHKAIDTYRELKAETNDTVYISFGNNLVSAELVCEMLDEDFTPFVHNTIGIENNHIELGFVEFKGKE